MRKTSLSLSNIKVGDIVYASSLTNIFNIHIILADCVNIRADVKGRIVYIGETLNEDSDKIVDENNHIMCI